MKERPRRSAGSLAKLRSFLLSQINRRKQRLKSGRSLSSVGRQSRVGRLLYGRLVVGSWYKLVVGR